MERINMVVPKWVRLVHKNGKYACSYDTARDVLLFVDRGGTITYDLTTIRDQAEARHGDSETGNDAHYQQGD